MNEEQLTLLSSSQDQQANLRKAITEANNALATKKYNVRTLTKKLDLYRAALDLGINLQDPSFTSNGGARKSSAPDPRRAISIEEKVDSQPVSGGLDVSSVTVRRPVNLIEADLKIAEENLAKARDGLAKVEAIEDVPTAVLDASKDTVAQVKLRVLSLIDEELLAKAFAKKIADQQRVALKVNAPVDPDIDWQPAQKLFGLRTKALKDILCPVYVGADQSVLDAVAQSQLIYPFDPNFFFNYEKGELLADILISLGAVSKSGNPANGNVWLWGQRGAGKSDLMAQIAGRLNRPLFVTSCHRELTIEQLGGEFDPRSVAQGESAPVLLNTNFSTGVTTPHSIVVLDEVARVTPTNAVGYNGALESRVLSRVDGSTAPFAKGVWIAVTDNTDGTGDPTGQFEAYPQDQSFLDRFRTTLHVPFLPEAEEAKVLIAKEGICAPVAKLIVKVMNAFRGASNGSGGHQARGLYPSLRGAFALSYSLREGKTFRRGIQQHLVGACIPSDREIANVLLDSICPSDEDVRDVLIGNKSEFTA